MAMVSPMPAKAEPARFRPPDASGPTVGANRRCIEDITQRRVSSRRGEEDGGIRRSDTGRGHASLPSFGTRCTMAGPTAACFGIIGRTSARLQWLWLCLKGSWGSGLYRDTGTAMVLRWSPTRIQGSLTPTLHCRARQESGIWALSMSVPVAPPGPSRFRYLHGPERLDPACLVPELDFFHLINSNWAAQRAIRLRHLCGPPGLAGF